MINSPNGRKIIDKVPITSVLTETDGSYVEVAGRVVTPEDIDLVHSIFQKNFPYLKQNRRNRLKKIFLV
jgi:uncharacterized pyridoxamine 5'-phosphate oxidase family protein